MKCTPYKKESKMRIGDTVQHYLTGSVGMVLDTVREVDATRMQHLVQWSDDKSFSRDSWERQEDLSKIPETSNPELYFEIKG
jgi:heat shock protein HspQ